MNGLPLDTILCGDALDMLRTLPDKSIDITVTSPPYNLDAHSLRSGGSFRARPYKMRFADYDGNAKDETTYQNWLYTIIEQCLRVSKGLVWINHKIRYRNGQGIHPRDFLPFPLWSEVIWNRMGSTMFNNKRFASSHEYLLGFGRPHYWYELNKLLTVWNIAPLHHSEHPCPFPEALIAPLIITSCPPGGIVLDPFMGAGTTGVVAVETGRHYVGIELNADYVVMANERIAHVTPALFPVTEWQPRTRPLQMQETNGARETDDVQLALWGDDGDEQDR